MMKLKINLSSLAFLSYWAIFVTYYVAGIALSSFWQMFCKLGINSTLLLLAIFALRKSTATIDRCLSLAGVTFFSGVTVFYLVSFLLFNFFQLAINDYVGYTFLLLLIVSLTLSITLTYARKKHL